MDHLCVLARRKRLALCSGVPGEFHPGYWALGRMVGLLVGTSELEGVRAESVRVGGREGMSEKAGQLSPSFSRVVFTMVHCRWSER